MRTRLTTGLRRSLMPASGQASAVSGAGDRLLYCLCAAAGLLAALTLGDVVYQLVSNSHLSVARFGLGFLGHQTWAVHFNQFGAAALIYGTAVTSFLALALAAPLGIAIAIYLAMIAPPRVRVAVGPVVEMLAAVPSVIFGFWGFFVLVPFIQPLEPGLYHALGFIPLFGAPQPVGISIFAAVIVLALMILPIISSLSRDLFLTVPNELTDGAAALGATRWEVIRGIVLPTTLSGVTAASVLALGRALGEAIAVSLVIGDVTAIHTSIFSGASTLAERIAVQFPATSTNLQRSSLFYLGLILLVMTLFTSLAARVITTRFSVQRAMAG
jgi:phosphate transport system permease protein